MSSAWTRTKLVVVFKCRMAKKAGEAVKRLALDQAKLVFTAGLCVIVAALLRAFLQASPSTHSILDRVFDTVRDGLVDALFVAIVILLLAFLLAYAAEPALVWSDMERDRDDERLERMRWQEKHDDLHGQSVIPVSVRFSRIGGRIEMRVTNHGAAAECEARLAVAGDIPIADGNWWKACWNDSSASAHLTSGQVGVVRLCDVVRDQQGFRLELLDPDNHSTSVPATSTDRGTGLPIWRLDIDLGLVPRAASRRFGVRFDAGHLVERVHPDTGETWIS